MKQKKTLQTEPLLQVEKLVVEYVTGRNRCVHAVSGISFDIARGEIFGLVGESGCGKTSVAKAIMQLPKPTAGKVFLNSVELTNLNRQELRLLRQKFQMVFQDPVASLNPRRKIGKSIAAPLRAAGVGDKYQQYEQTHKLLKSVGLAPDQYHDRLPFQLSGGQCQRASIARALICNPQLLVCDEPVSSLDVSVQAQIINLLSDLKTEYGLSMLFISHDLAVVKNICDRVAVMYLGHLCEIASTEKFYQHPLHPYTRALMNAIPHPDPELPPTKIGILPGELPSAAEPPPGCRFHTRCPRAQADCSSKIPSLREVGPDHQVACHYPHFEETGEER